MASKSPGILDREINPTLPRTVLTSSKPAAASIEPAIEIRTSQRHGNCVSCNGFNNIQIGRLSGRDMNNANKVSTTTGRRGRQRRESNNAGANNMSVINARMFIHHTLRLSGENVESRKLTR